MIFVESINLSDTYIEGCCEGRLVKGGSTYTGTDVKMINLLLCFWYFHLFTLAMFRKEVEAKHRAVQDKKERVRNALASNRWTNHLLYFSLLL